MSTNPNPQKLLRVLSGSLRAVATLHEPAIADVLHEAAVDLLVRAAELSKLTGLDAASRPAVDTDPAVKLPPRGGDALSTD
jgi:hypothetical protein